MPLGRTRRATPHAPNASMLHGAARRTRTMSASEDDSEHSSQAASPSCPLTASDVHSPTEARPSQRKARSGSDARVPARVRCWSASARLPALRVRVTVGLHCGRGRVLEARHAGASPARPAYAIAHHLVARRNTLQARRTHGASTPQAHRKHAASMPQARRKRAVSPSPGVVAPQPS
jgi:hypothetical protein